MTSTFPEHQARPIGICIDYDDTFTTNPPLWTQIIELLRANGANVFCITLRKPDCPIRDFPGEVHYAAGQPKWEFAHANRIDVHIWIDDWPAIIGENPLKRDLLPPQVLERAQHTPMSLKVYSSGAA